MPCLDTPAPYAVANQRNLPLNTLSHPREVIRQFTPNWFAATMGTGILALTLGQLPVQIPGLQDRKSVV